MKRIRTGWTDGRMNKARKKQIGRIKAGSVSNNIKNIVGKREL